MKEINKFFYKILIVICFSVNAESKTLELGNPNAKVNIKVFSSLTCPHCANFHAKIFEDLKKEYIDKPTEVVYVETENELLTVKDWTVGGKY